MQNPDFWDFIMEGGYDLLFPDDAEKEFECPYCSVLLAGDERVEWVDRERRVFRCPECDEEIKVR